MVLPIFPYGNDTDPIVSADRHQCLRAVEGSGMCQTGTCLSRGNRCKGTKTTDTVKYRQVVPPVVPVMK
jgi:hypothetical protein